MQQSVWVSADKSMNSNAMRGKCGLNRQDAEDAKKNQDKNPCFLSVLSAKSFVKNRTTDHTDSTDKKNKSGFGF
jgi:hypothetical protein